MPFRIALGIVLLANGLVPAAVLKWTPTCRRGAVPSSSSDVPRCGEVRSPLAKTSWRAEAKLRAISAYSQLFTSAERRGNRLSRAIYAVQLGDCHLALGHASQAIVFYERALDSERLIPSVTALAHAGISRALLRVDEIDEAWNHAEQALRLSETTDDTPLQMYALVTAGIARYDAADFEASLGYSYDALRFDSAVRNRALASEAWLHIGFARSDMSDEAIALDAFRTAAELARAGANGLLEGQALVGLGHTYSKIGEKQKAFDAYLDAEPLVEAAGDPFLSASLSTGMGYVYSELGDYETAERYFEEGLQLSDEVGSRFGRAANLAHLGRIRESRGRLEEALWDFRGALHSLSGLPDRGLAPTVLGELAGVLDRLGRHQEATRAYAGSLALRARDCPRCQADILNRLGEVDRRNGRLEQARGRFSDAVTLCQRTRSAFLEPRALFNLATVERSLGEPELALHASGHALSLVERLRGLISSYRLRSSYVASVHEIPELRVELLLESHDREAAYGPDAFLAAEMSKARSLLDLFARAPEEDLRPEDAPLSARAKRLEEDIDRRLVDWYRTVDEFSDDVDGNEIPRELESELTELDQVRASLRSRQGGTASFDSTRLASISDLQNNYLDEGSLLLSYFLGQDRSYLWAISQSDLHVYSLPPQAAIETSVRHILGILTARERFSSSSARLRHRAAQRADLEYWAAAAGLSETLLGPALRESSATRLLIAGDGVLHALPFSSLPAPGVHRHTVPLVTRYEIVRLPSATLLKAIAPRRPLHGSPPTSVAVLADPVFDARDPRIAVGPTSLVARTGPGGKWEAGTSPRLSNGSPMPRLLATRREARAIFRLVTPAERLEALGFKANRSLVQNGGLAGYGVVHFATHGLTNTRRAELSALVLSLVDSSGRVQNGFLRLPDIDQLNLSAELVVLSACRTALASELPGESTSGLVGGFLSAGARGVVASYWNVDDDATSELMQRFYAGLLSDKLSAPRALQKAQIAMLQEPRWQSPYYFGAFEFHGRAD